MAQAMSASPSMRLNEAVAALSTPLIADATLRSQICFTEFLEKRSQDQSYTFQQHLRWLGGAIEE